MLKIFFQRTNILLKEAWRYTIFWHGKSVCVFLSQFCQSKNFLRSTIVAPLLSNNGVGTQQSWSIPQAKAIVADIQKNNWDFSLLSCPPNTPPLPPPHVLLLQVSCCSRQLTQNQQVFLVSPNAWWWDFCCLCYLGLFGN